MSGFTAECQQVGQDLLSSVFAGAGAGQQGRLSDPQRMQEAVAAAPCVDRFTEYELNPPGGKGVGRATGIAIIPPLGSLLAGKKVERLDDAERATLRGAIAAALAYGYLGLASADRVEWGDETVEPQINLDPAELWRRWVPQLFAGLGGDDEVGGPARTGSGPLDGLNVHDDGELDRALREIRSRASERLVEALGRLGLMPKRLKRMRLKLVEAKYVDAGMVLRVVQGTSAPQGPDAAGYTERSWPFEVESE